MILNNHPFFITRVVYTVKENTMRPLTLDSLFEGRYEPYSEEEINSGAFNKKRTTPPTKEGHKAVRKLQRRGPDGVDGYSHIRKGVPKHAYIAHKSLFRTGKIDQNSIEAMRQNREDRP